MKRLFAFIFFLMSAEIIMSQKIIDVHAHLITDDFVSELKKENRLLDEGFPLPKYNIEQHIKWMDDNNVSTSVLTLAAPQPSSASTIRKKNEEAASLKQRYPGRFLFCAALPLPEVDAAIKEAIYALDILKADGIKLATNVAGQYLGTPELDTLFSVLNSRKAVVILHPHRPEPVNKQVMQQTPLAMQEYLSETTRAVANMFSRNVLARYPNVKIVIPHCGAYLPLAVPRMKSLTAVMQANKLVGEIDWQANLNSLYFDLAGAHSPEVIRMMLTITTPEHILYGSDYPYVAPQVLTTGIERMKKYLAEEPDLMAYKDMFFHQNAERLFNLSDGAAITVTNKEKDDMIVRIAEIEVFPEFLNEYLEYATEVDRLSVEREPGVICLFPMQDPADSCQIRILEIYANDAVYQAHLKTDHFQKYKQGTLKMVKSLKLNTMHPIDKEMMKAMFGKMK